MKLPFWPWKAAPPSVAERLAATLKPRPDLRDRRFATWSMERRQRYLDANYGEPQSLLRRAAGFTAQSPNLPVSVCPQLADTGLYSCSGSSAEKMAGCGRYCRLAAQDGVAFTPANFRELHAVNPTLMNQL